MKLLLAFTPFHTPASPPLGLAYLKAALAEARPAVEVRTVDWNLNFFRRWLHGDGPDLCEYHPTHLLGSACPSLVVTDGVGDMILDDLTHLPATSDQQNRYMQAARLLDDLYNRLASAYHDILFPVVEGRTPLPERTADALFSTELATVQAERPDLVGFSILSEQNLLYALALGRVIHDRFGIPIALGGAMTSHLEPAELLRGFPWLHYVFFGEAEKSLVEFVDAWPTRAFVGIRGLAYREDGDIVVHERPEQLHLDTLPAPDFSDFSLHTYIAPEPVLPAITSRGCYWGKCTFCSHTLPYGGGVRVRRPEAVVDEIERQMQRYGVDRFLFVDEAISPRTLTQLSDEILARSLDIRFGAEGVRVERTFDESLLRRAYDAGLRWVYVGIESSVQRLLDVIEKGIDIDTIERFIETCKRIGITPQLSFIIGLPGTTREELAREIEFLKRYPMDASPFVLLYGSPMQRRPEALGIRIEDRQVLYATPRGPVHAPRFYFTIEKGVSPAVADVVVEDAGPRPRMRPHLGEVHATLLADTDFFEREGRPPAPASAAEIALGTLTRQRQAGMVDGRWFLHVASCLEEQGQLDQVWTVVQAGLATGGLLDRDKAALHLHAATMLNQSEQLAQALQITSRAEVTGMPALRGERIRGLYALDRPADVICEAETMLLDGHEIRWIHYIRGLCHERIGQPGEALAALDAAEARDWLEPEINDARARCLQALGQSREARNERAKATRKRRYLGINHEPA